MLLFASFVCCAALEVCASPLLYLYLYLLRRPWQPGGPKPCPFAMTARSQTLLGALLPMSTHRYTRRQVVPAREDGVPLVLDWKERPSMPADAPLLVVCHGLGGSSASAHCRATTDAALRRGWRSVAYNRRGHVPGYGLLPPSGGGGAKGFPAHADLDDMLSVLDSLRASYPRAPLLLSGFSAGANLVVRALAVARPIGVAAAASVSNSYNIVDLTKQFSPQADALMVQALRGLFTRNLRDLQAIAASRKVRIDWRAAAGRSTLREFEERFLLPLTRPSYDSLDAYYEAQQCSACLADVRVPLLCLNALDDPLYDRSFADIPAQADSELIRLLTTERGGHLGWLFGWRCERWDVQQVMAFFEEQLGSQLPSQNASGCTGGERT